MWSGMAAELAFVSGPPNHISKSWSSSVLKKQRDQEYICLRSVQSKVFFPGVRYGWEGWTIQKSECQKTDAFEMWCWRRPESSLTEGRSNQPILKEISPEYSLERLMLKLKRQYFGHLMHRANSLEKTPILGKI